MFNHCIMSQSRFASFIILFLCCASFIKAPDTTYIVQVPADRTEADLTVTYTIELMKAKNKSIGIGEAYNGGTKTIFVSNGLARLRLVSLMRMQSIFLLPSGNPERVAAIVKESGKNKHKVYLSATQWKQYNAKYDQATCRLTDDTASVSGYRCKKAVLSLADGRSITAFYTQDIQRAELAAAEPVFACIPGLVLKYTYEYKKGKITYTATAISRKPIDQNILKVPSKGYTVQEYQSGAMEEKDK